MTTQPTCRICGHVAAYHRRYGCVGSGACDCTLSRQGVLGWPAACTLLEAAYAAVHYLDNPGYGTPRASAAASARWSAIAETEEVNHGY